MLYTILQLISKIFHHTLEESLKAYEEQEKYEKCAEIKKAMDWLEKKKS